jgi:dephospho-CoA kinase
VTNIALYGRTGSGKTTVALYLVQRHQYAHRHPGARCRSLALELFGTESKTVLNALSDCLRSIDANVWIRAELKREPDDSRLIVFDGMRYQEDLAFLRSLGFSAWQVVCDSKARRDRLSRRGQVFTATDETHSAETDLEDARFDVVLTNDGTVAQLYGQVDAMLQQIP